MPLIRNGTTIDDPWIVATEAAELRQPGPVIVTLALWQALRDTLSRRNGGLGIRLASDESPALIAADLDRFDVVALEFPKFTDGRAYSYARLLRERYGYTREVRAVGNVLRDQLLFMQRCGFDTFAVADARAAAAWREALAEIDSRYQPAADDGTPITDLRRRRLGAAPAARREEPASFACAAHWAY